MVSRRKSLVAPMLLGGPELLRNSYPLRKPPMGLGPATPPPLPSAIAIKQLGHDGHKQHGHSRQVGKQLMGVVACRRIAPVRTIRDI